MLPDLSFSSSSDSMLVSDLSSLSLSTTALFLPEPVPDVKVEDDEEIIDIEDDPELVLTFADWVLSGVRGRGRPTGSSLSRRLGTRDWSKSWSTLGKYCYYLWVKSGLIVTYTVLKSQTGCLIHKAFAFFCLYLNTASFLSSSLLM